MRPTAAISWSGGKDSCAAYHRARADYDIVAAITMFTEDGARSRSHGLRPEVLAAQLDRLGLTALSDRCSWHTYDQAFARALESAARMGVSHVIFGDILFDEHREWAERLSGTAGLAAVEPLWRQSTTDLYREVLSSGTRARIVTVRTTKLDDSFLGRELTADLLPDLISRDVDPCGELGEYHTVVTDCPAFSRPLRVRAGNRAIVGDCIAEDLVLDE